MGRIGRRPVTTLTRGLQATPTHQLLDSLAGDHFTTVPQRHPRAAIRPVALLMDRTHMLDEPAIGE